MKKNFKSWAHQVQPLTMLYIIIIMFKGRASIIGRINIDAIHFSGI